MIISSENIMFEINFIVLMYISTNEYFILFEHSNYLKVIWCFKLIKIILNVLYTSTYSLWAEK